MSTNLVFPKCATCGDTIGVAIGLPVVVTFDPATNLATISVDLSEIADVEGDELICDCGQTTTEAGDYAEICDRLAELSEAVRDVTLPLTLEKTYAMRGYGCCGACGQMHYAERGQCDLDPIHEVSDPETCEDRGYECCDTLTDEEHTERHGYPMAGREDRNDG